MSAKAYLLVFSEQQAAGSASHMASGEWIAVSNRWPPDGDYIDEDDITKDND